MRVAVCARACFEYGKERDSVGWKGGGGEDPHTDAKLAAVRHSCSSALLCSLSVVDFLSARRVFCGAGSAGRVRGSQTRRLPLRLQLPHDCRVHPPAGARAPARGSTLCLSPFCFVLNDPRSMAPFGAPAQASPLTVSAALSGLCRGAPGQLCGVVVGNGARAAGRGFGAQDGDRPGEATVFYSRWP